MKVMMIAILAFGGSIFTSINANTLNNNFDYPKNIAATLHFVDPPADITVQCMDAANQGQALRAVNTDANCLTDVLVNPVVSGNANICGGQLIYSWNYTDICGDSISHVQTIWIQAAPVAYFVNPPSNITVNYNIPNITLGNLEVSNQTGPPCNFNALLPPLISGSYNLCGGSITGSWTYTDLCGRSISHTQNVFINPKPQAQFVSPPADVTIDCASYPFASLPSLILTNNVNGPGSILETIAPTVVDSVFNCEGFVELIYSYTDDCGRLTYHKQRITIAGEKFTISGFCFTDANANNIFDNTNDYALSNVAIRVLGDSVIHYTDNNGYFDFQLDSGIQQIKYFINFGSWDEDTIVRSINISKPINFSFVGFIPADNDLESGLVTLASSQTGCKTFADLNVQVFNSSSKLLNGYLIIHFDPKTYFSSVNPLPSGGQDQFLVWNISGLPPGNIFSPNIEFWIPDIGATDDSLYFKTILIGSGGDTLSVADYAFKVDCNTNSDFTLNFPDRLGEENFTLIGETITYLVTFQNHLNTIANGVKITNLLDESIDLSSVKIHKASHYFKVISIDGELIFNSDSIHLNPQSSGYILFSLDQKPELTPHTIITHEAAIQFNNSVTKTTRKVKNTIVSELPCDLLNTTIMSSNNMLYMSEKGSTYSWYKCGSAEVLYIGNHFTPDKNGSYYCIVEGQNCKTISTCFDFISTSIKNITEEKFTIFPNPVGEKLYIDMQEGNSIEVRDIYGKVMLITNDIYIDFSILSKGIYFVYLVKDAKATKMSKVIKL